MFRADGSGGRRADEGDAELDEQRLDRELRLKVQLLETPPRLADELDGPLGPGETLGRGVLGELRQVVVVRDDCLGADGDADQVAIPRGELLQRLEHALTLRAELDAPPAQVGLALGQVEPLESLSTRSRTSFAPASTRSSSRPAATDVENVSSA